MVQCVWLAFALGTQTAGTCGSLIRRRTPLTTPPAGWYNHAHVLRELLYHGADPDAVRRRHSLALQLPG